MKRLIIALACMGIAGQLQSAQPTGQPNFTVGIDQASLDKLQTVADSVKIGLSDGFAKAAASAQNVKVTADLGLNAITAIEKLSHVTDKFNGLIKTMQQGGVPPINATIGINPETALAFKNVSDSLDKIAQGVKTSHTIDVSPRFIRFSMGMGVVGAGTAAGCAFGKDLFNCATNSNNNGWKRIGAGASLAAIATAVGLGGGLLWHASL